MCRGIQKRDQRTLCSREAAPFTATPSKVCCELCGSRASLYCQADDAFLCRKCDKWVHEANFLAFRHVRCLLCNTCQKLTQRYLIGASSQLGPPTMVDSGESRQCTSEDEEECSRSPKMPFLFL